MSDNDRPVDPVRTREQAAAQLNISARTLDRLGLPKIRIGPKLVGIRQSIIDRYKVEHEK
jgi:hypothetical protein